MPYNSPWMNKLAIIRLMLQVRNTFPQYTDASWNRGRNISHGYIGCNTAYVKLEAENMFGNKYIRHLVLLQKTSA